MTLENKQLNTDCNKKYAITQSLKADTLEIIATYLDENNNRIKAMSNLHWAKIDIKDQTIHEQAKELQGQRNISNIASFFF